MPNRERYDGCTLLDLGWTAAPFANHGHFVRTVEQVTELWRLLGLMSEPE